MDSKIPGSRFAEGGGAFTLTTEGISREEIRYNKFIQRLRSAYKELLTKPLYLQMCLDIKELRNDPKFPNAVGLKWHNDNVFEEIKEQDLINKRIATVNALKAVANDDKTPYFSTEYLIKEHMKLSDEAIQKNKDYLASYGAAAEAAEASGGESGGGKGGAAPAAATGEPGEFKTELGAKGQL